MDMRSAPRTHGSRAVSAFALAGVLVAAAAVAEPLPPDLAALVRTLPADALVAPLRRYEATHPSSPAAADAAFLLGQLEYARGEYRPAAESFARAAARIVPTRKAEARYWEGLAWLALGETEQTRAALEEVARGGGPRRPLALLGVAQAWDLARQPGRAGETLAGLLAGDPAEAGPAVLAMTAAFAERTGADGRARTARDRLLAEYPRSIEAAEARRAVFGPGEGRDAVPARSGALAVVIGSFVDAARARSLAAAARAAGFPDAKVLSRGAGLAAVHTVRLGLYPRVAEARRAGEQAALALGVSYELTRAP